MPVDRSAFSLHEHVTSRKLKTGVCVQTVTCLHFGVCRQNSFPFISVASFCKENWKCGDAKSSSVLFPLNFLFLTASLTLSRVKKNFNSAWKAFEQKFYFLQLLIRDERDLSASRVVVSINQIFFEGLFKHVLFKAFFSAKFRVLLRHKVVFTSWWCFLLVI